jgi:hypothetical protein
MKCISVIQPWATLLVRGVKRIETRRWRTHHRGRLAIHAAQNFPEDARARSLAEPFCSHLRQAGFRHWSELPRGAIIGTVDLLDCVPAEQARRELTESAELDFGDYSSNHWAWRLANPVAFAVPIPFSGRMRVFTVPDLEKAF